MFKVILMQTKLLKHAKYNEILRFTSKIHIFLKVLTDLKHFPNLNIFEFNLEIIDLPGIFLYQVHGKFEIFPHQFHIHMFISTQSPPENTHVIQRVESNESNRS